MFHGYTFQYPEDTLIKRFAIIKYTHICKNYKRNDIIICVALWNASAKGIPKLSTKVFDKISHVYTICVQMEAPLVYISLCHLFPCIYNQLHRGSTIQVLIFTIMILLSTIENHF